MGMIASVFRDDKGDCSNKGLSAYHSRVLVVNVDGPFTVRDGLPAVKMVKGNLRGTVKIVPLNEHESGKWLMFGGTYVGTSDSRFGEKVKEIAGEYGAEFPASIVPFHDRVEG
jgi:hypothetical protein